MAYIVKYIEYCEKLSIDVDALCAGDIKLGYIVFLVFQNDKQNFTVSKDKNINILKTVNNRSSRLYAVEKAIELGAEKCQYYLKENGIFSLNPREYCEAIPISKMDYDEVLELTIAGYNALGYDVVETAKRHSMIIEILSYTSSSGTIIKEVFGMEGMFIKSVIKDPNIAAFTLTDIPDKKGASYHIFKELSDAGIIVDNILLPAGNGRRQDISFTVKLDDKISVQKILEKQKENLEYEEMIVSDSIAKVSIIGAGIQSRFGVAAELLKTLYENDINVMMIMMTEIKIAVIIEKEKSDLAVREIHKAFIK